MRRLAVFRALAAVVLVLLPYAIAPFYRFIDPVSTPMLWRWATGAAGRAAFRPAEPHFARAAALRHRRRGRQLLPQSRHRPRRDARGIATIRRQSRRSRGASTITQQTAKNLFLWQGRSFVRKALEIPLALWLNLVLPKRRILEIYLNIAEWGPNGEFGAEAGARWAFGKSARDLNPREAAELAAILPNPVQRSARTPSMLGAAAGRPL